MVFKLVILDQFVHVLLKPWSVSSKRDKSKKIMKNCLQWIMGKFPHKTWVNARPHLLALLLYLN